MKQAYLSGPITGHDKYDVVRSFTDAEYEVYRKGYEPINPLNNGLSDYDSHELHMKADIAKLIRCDAIYLMKGWENSQGCQIEKQVAIACGVEIILSE